MILMTWYTEFLCLNRLFTKPNYEQTTMICSINSKGINNHFRCQILLHPYTILDVLPLAYHNFTHIFHPFSVLQICCPVEPAQLTHSQLFFRFMNETNSYLFSPHIIWLLHIILFFFSHSHTILQHREQPLC